MADDELKKLKRADLLDKLLDVMRENEQLKAELSEARAQLAERQLDLLDAGSIAEASMRLNGVFEAAQAAAESRSQPPKRSHSRPSRHWLEKARVFAISP